MSSITQISMKELSSGRVGWSGGIPNIPGIPVSLMVKLQDLFKQEFAHSLQHGNDGICIHLRCRGFGGVISAQPRIATKQTSAGCLEIGAWGTEKM